ncbi:MAG: HdeD family acid-resistance protein, partial [Anaerolineales bacterium]
VLVLLFGAYALVDGLFALITGLTRYGESPRWWVFLIEGLVGIAAGILTFVWPGLTGVILLYLIAGWAIFTGVFEVVAAIRLRKEIDNEWLLALGGVASVIFGVLLVLRPAAGALAVVWLIGAYALIFGALLVALGLRLRSWHTHRETLRPA